MRGCVFNIQRYSIGDGPGIRTTVFFKGCPLRCAWCHNPEGLSFEAGIRWVSARCIQCGECRAVCPRQGPHVSECKDNEAAAVCLRCGACVEFCPTRAREWTGRDMTLEEVLTEVAADRLFYDDSGGGVTLSGGEPLQQAEFVMALLKACREAGLHTAVDTSGYASPDCVGAAADLADLILFDLKLIDDRRHLEWTGVSNRLILSNLELLAKRRAKVWIRVPVIPGANDAPGDLELLADHVVGLPCRMPVYLLPYHHSALHKYQSLGLSYRLHNVMPPTPPELEQAAGHFRRRGLLTFVGG